MERIMVQVPFPPAKGTKRILHSMFAFNELLRLLASQHKTCDAKTCERM